MRRRSISVDEPLYREIRRRAEELGLSASGLIRLLMKTCLADRDDDTIAVTTRGPRGSRITVVRLIPQTRITALMREVTDLKKRIKELEEEKRRLLEGNRKLIRIIAEEPGCIEE